MTIATSVRVGGRTKSKPKVKIALPPATLSFSQDEEWCVVRVNGEWREIRLHDYEALYAIPGLYEHLIYDILKCNSPARVRKHLEAELVAGGVSPSTLRTLDLGAGNGMVGEELAAMGVEFIVGADIIQAAADATRRDRPGVYADYHVGDVTRLSGSDRGTLEGYGFNCLTCVAALGFGDIPTEAFAAAFNLVESDGWVAFNIKASFLDEGDTSGFGRFIRSVMADKRLEVSSMQRYQHRLGTDGEPIYYAVIVGRKRRDIIDVHAAQPR